MIGQNRLQTGIVCNPRTMSVAPGLKSLVTSLVGKHRIRIYHMAVPNAITLMALYHVREAYTLTVNLFMITTKQKHSVRTERNQTFTRYPKKYGVNDHRQYSAVKHWAELAGTLIAQEVSATRARGLFLAP